MRAAADERAVECRVRCGRSVSCPATPFGDGPRRVYRILTSYVWRGGALYLSSKAVYFTRAAALFTFLKIQNKTLLTQDLHRMHAVNSACCGTQCTVTERRRSLYFNFLSRANLEQDNLLANRESQPKRSRRHPHMISTGRRWKLQKRGGAELIHTTNNKCTLLVVSTDKLTSGNVHLYITS